MASLYPTPREPEMVACSAPTPTYFRKSVEGQLAADFVKGGPSMGAHPSPVLMERWQKGQLRSSKAIFLILLSRVVALGVPLTTS